MRPSGGGKTRLVFLVPSRGLIGYHGEFLTDTRGTGVMSRLFHGYAPLYAARSKAGATASSSPPTQGDAVAYALWFLEERGEMFIDPGDAVYEGMIIGENSRGHDLEVNPLKSKQLTNIRTTSKDEAIRLTPPRPDHPRTGHRLYRGRRARRGDAEIDPPAQGDPRPQRLRKRAERNAPRRRRA